MNRCTIARTLAVFHDSFPSFKMSFLWHPSGTNYGWVDTSNWRSEIIKRANHKLFVRLTPQGYNHRTQSNQNWTEGDPSTDYSSAQQNYLLIYTANKLETVNPQRPPWHDSVKEFRIVSAPPPRSLYGLFVTKIKNKENDCSEYTSVVFLLHKGTGILYENAGIENTIFAVQFVSPICE